MLRPCPSPTPTSRSLELQAPQLRAGSFLAEEWCFTIFCTKLKACLLWFLLPLNKKMKTNPWVRSPARVAKRLINLMHVPSQGQVTIRFSFQFNQSRRVSFSLHILAKKGTCPSLAPSRLHQQIDLIVSRGLWNMKWLQQRSGETPEAQCLQQRHQGAIHLSHPQAKQKSLGSLREANKK